MTQPSKVLNTAAAVRAHLLASGAGFTAPSAASLTHRADARTVAAADRDARDAELTAAMVDEAITTRRTSLVYSADALSPAVPADDAPALPWTLPEAEASQVSEPTKADYARQLEDVREAERQARADSRSNTVKGVAMSAADHAKLDAFLSELRRHKYRLMDRLAAMDAGIVETRQPRNARIA